MKHPSICTRLILAAGLFFLTRCVVPYESARMLPKGDTELKAAFTHASQHLDGESGALNNGFGVGLGYGATDNINLKIRYERIFPEGSDGEGINFFSFGPKFALKHNKIAAMLPIGAYFVEGENTWMMNPALLFTASRNEKFEATFGLRGDIFFEEGADFLMGLNVGLGLSENLDRWAIRPDFGLVFNPGEKGVLLTFGLGVNYNIESR